MFFRLVLVVGPLTLAACPKPLTQENLCEDLCFELVSDCQYEAFPSYESCMQGCAYDAEQGADVGGELQCVQAAECDTFAILECEHAYGLD